MDSFVKTITTLDTNKDDNLAIIYSKGQFLTTTNNNVLFSLANAIALSQQTKNFFISIGLWNNHPVYLVLLSEQLAIDTNMQWQTLRPIMLQSDSITFKMLGYALQIAIWFINNKFCGRCGHEMHYIATHEFRMDCPNCQYISYPRLNPSMIILVTQGEKILLAQSHRFTNNMYSTLAGFVEPGESVEQCVYREVWEEVKITVKNLRYVGSQNWPYPNSLMFGFHAEYNTGTITPQTEEIADARWFSIHELPTLPPKQAISRYLIDLYTAQYLGGPEPAFPN